MILNVGIENLVCLLFPFLSFINSFFFLCLFFLYTIGILISFCFCVENFRHVLGIDVDPESLEIAGENVTDLELDVDFLRCDIRTLNLKGLLVDTIVMNPPFGTRKKGADMDFLSLALKVASRAVYSLHKTSTRELRFDVPQMYKFHKKKEVDIAVDLWRFVP
ncbi:hypothetical protein FCM35_KLT00059 [Carex littledalei]|uniref:Ribosomal RNA large subunit methyltransferase K/L-like methyltransferase domain-containing protein n=1 Tax=Carex littledalei TaxID=544730 RepID=A0A833RT81_9POAL|nr:hypothetical protein FCM35_KLT00059 [Carex littledalei]